MMRTKEKNEAGRGWKWLAWSGKAALRKVTFERRPGEDGAVSMQGLGREFSAERTDAEVGAGRRERGESGAGWWVVLSSLPSSGAA